MSRRAIIAAIAVYFLFTLAFGFGLEWSGPLAAEQKSSALLVGALETAFLAFVIPGILPLAFWGFGRFRSERAPGSLFVWSVLGVAYMILVGLGSFWNQEIRIGRTDDNIVRLGGSVHDTLVRSMNTGCIENQKRRRASGDAITDQQIDTFCRCFADAISKEVSASEIMDITNTGRPSASFQEKANKIAPECIRIALGK
jgi:hypothetical protein